LNQRSIKICVAATTLIIIFLTSGCATQYGQRVKDDFRDTFKAYAGVGIGLHADVKVTNLFHPGIGWAGIWMNAGLRDRYSPFVFASEEFALFPLALTNTLMVDQKEWYLSETLRMANGRLLVRKNQQGMEPFVCGSLFDYDGLKAFDSYGVEKIVKHPSFFKGKGEPAYTEQPFGVELGLGLLFFNIRIGFDAIEFIDLFTTSLGWDILHDNPEMEESPPADIN
jgi:hypothetical protein